MTGHPRARLALTLMVLASLGCFMAACGTIPGTILGCAARQAFSSNHCD